MNLYAEVQKNLHSCNSIKMRLSWELALRISSKNTDIALMPHLTKFEASLSLNQAPFSHLHWSKSGIVDLQSTKAIKSVHRTVPGRCRPLTKSAGLTVWQRQPQEARNVALSFSHVSWNVIIRQLNATKKFVLKLTLVSNISKLLILFCFYPITM